MKATDRIEKQNHSLPDTALSCKASAENRVSLQLRGSCAHRCPHRCTVCSALLTEREICPDPSAHIAKVGRRTCCVPPAEKPSARVLDGGRVVTAYPPGRLGGESRPFIDRTTGDIHWIDVVIVDEGASKRPVPVETFLEATHAAAFLGVKLSTLYAWSPHMKSIDKRGSLLVFYVDDLVNDDMVDLAERLPTRRDIEQERVMRGAQGEWLRPGRHVRGCLRDHPGSCSAVERPLPKDRKKR